MKRRANKWLKNRESKEKKKISNINPDTATVVGAAAVQGDISVNSVFADFVSENLLPVAKYPG